VARQIEAHWNTNGRLGAGDKLLMSFHGVPERTLHLGDPYHCQCYKTARLLAEALQLDKSQYQVSFQSRFGKAEWLQPYTDKTLEALGAAGTQRIDVICPGFAADCLETLEEIADEARETFIEAGGKSFNYLPVANDSENYIHALATIAQEHLVGWIDPAFSAEAAAASNTASATRAKQIGASQ